MSLLALTAANLTPGGANPLNLTALLTSIGANTGVTWVNTGRELLVVSVGTTPTTLTSDIGTMIQGQTVPGVSSGALPVSGITVMPPYPLQYNKQDGTNTIEIDFSSQTNISVALIHVPGVF